MSVMACLSKRTDLKEEKPRYIVIPLYIHDELPLPVPLCGHAANCQEEIAQETNIKIQEQVEQRAVEQIVEVPAATDIREDRRGTEDLCAGDYHPAPHAVDTEVREQAETSPAAASIADVRGSAPNPREAARQIVEAAWLQEDVHSCGPKHAYVNLVREDVERQDIECYSESSISESIQHLAVYAFRHLGCSVTAACSASRARHAVAALCVQALTPEFVDRVSRLWGDDWKDEHRKAARDVAETFQRQTQTRN